MNAIHYKIKEDGRYVSRAVHIVLAFNPEGRIGLESFLLENEKTSIRLFLLPRRDQEIIYTANVIESVYHQFKKLTKTKKAFLNENSLLKLLYMELMNTQEKWTEPVQNWRQTLSRLNIYFEGHLDHEITFYGSKIDLT